MPFDSDAITPDHAVYLSTELLPSAVGSKPQGKGRWGHADLSGNVDEWTLDYFVARYPSTQCIDCLATTGVAGRRSIRGGSFDISGQYLYSSSRVAHPESQELYQVGFRCARDVVAP
jgi:formylglycine-generating enzyme required for sulfatase activity